MNHARLKIVECYRGFGIPVHRYFGDEIMIKLMALNYKPWPRVQLHRAVFAAIKVPSSRPLTKHIHFNVYCYYSSPLFFSFEAKRKRSLSLFLSCRPFRNFNRLALTCTITALCIAIGSGRYTILNYIIVLSM